VAPKPTDKGRSRSKSADSKARVRRGKPKVCVFCGDHTTWVDYKDVNLLRRFMSDRGKIKSRGNTGTCAQHQRDVAKAIKVARELALLPYAVRTFAGDKAGPRRRGPGRPSDTPAADVDVATITGLDEVEDGDDAEEIEIDADAAPAEV
jgi:small subunit ribosomal protein S18